MTGLQELFACPLKQSLGGQKQQPAAPTLPACSGHGYVSRIKEEILLIQRPPLEIFAKARRNHSFEKTVLGPQEFIFTIYAKYTVKKI